MQTKFIKTDDGLVLLSLHWWEKNNFFTKEHAQQYKHLTMEQFKTIGGDVLFLASCLVVNPVTLVNKAGYYDRNGQLIDLQPATVRDVFDALRSSHDEIKRLRAQIDELEGDVT